MRTELRVTLIAIAWAAASFATTLRASELKADDHQSATSLQQQRPDISGDPEKPRRHYRIRNAARLSKDEARELYQGIFEDLTAGYAASGDPTADAFPGWPRYNDAPYRSATHGQRYVNNYANERASAYGRYEAAGKLPEGAVIAKDSITVTESGEVSAGPLFVMEKMAAGFNYVTGDWRYAVITPEGEILGRTKGPGAERVEYCIGCHLVRERFDHLYFVPEAYRVAE